MSITIDSHQHYWQLNRFDYAWIPSDNAALHQDRMPEDVLPQMRAAHVERAVLVHATGISTEIPWLLSLCDTYPHFAGVVGWVDMTSPSVSDEISHLAQDSRFRGVRLHLPFDENHKPFVDSALRTLASHTLSCDLLLGQSQLPNAVALIEAHPDTTFILDHLAGARITATGAADFKQSIRPLLNLPNAFMKVSGYMTAQVGIQDRDLPAILAQYIAAAISSLGADRLMFGSDWPVSSQAAPYGHTVAVLRDITMQMTMSEQDAIWGGSAARAYGL